MRIVIVDDNTTNLAVLTQMTCKLPDVVVEGFADSALALADMRRKACDLAVVDNIMPGISGMELVTLIREIPGREHIPIIMVTADGDRDVRLASIRAGATDFLTKPVDPLELRARVSNLLTMRDAQIRLERRAEELSEAVAVATRNLAEREEDMIYRLARAIECRDNETGDHVERVARVARVIAEQLQQPGEFVRTLWLAAPLHDLGKIGIPDAILNKPGKLTDEEYTAMQRHTHIGASLLGGGVSNLHAMAEEIAHGHHERWDGTGYPMGIAGNHIPLAARITAVADVFDALCSTRAYKPAWPVDEARREIVRCSGTQFDPACVAAFERAWPAIIAIYQPHAATASTAA